MFQIETRVSMIKRNLWKATVSGRLLEKRNLPQFVGLNFNKWWISQTFSGHSFVGRQVSALTEEVLSEMIPLRGSNWTVLRRSFLLRNSLRCPCSLHLVLKAICMRVDTDGKLGSDRGYPIAIQLLFSWLTESPFSADLTRAPLGNLSPSLVTANIVCFSMAASYLTIL